MKYTKKEVADMLLRFLKRNRKIKENKDKLKKYLSRMPTLLTFSIREVEYPPCTLLGVELGDSFIVSFSDKIRKPGSHRLDYDFNQIVLTEDFLKVTYDTIELVFIYSIEYLGSTQLYAS